MNKISYPEWKKLLIKAVSNKFGLELNDLFNDEGKRYYDDGWTVEQTCKHLHNKYDLDDLTEPVRW